MRIVRPWDVYSTLMLCWQSFIFGLCLFMPTCILLAVSLLFLQPTAATSGVTFVLAGVSIAVTLLIGPIIGLVIWRVHLNTTGRRVLAALCTSTGIFIVLHIIAGIGVGFRQFSMLGIWLTIHAVLFLAWMLVTLIAWPFIVRRWPFKIQDGQSCPQCGYCVRGVTSMKCPECGTAFDHTQLGLEPDEFERLMAGKISRTHRASR